MISLQRILCLAVICAVSLDGALITKKKKSGVFFHKTVVQFNPKYLQDHKLHINADHYSLDVTLNVITDMERDPFVEIGISLQRSQGDNFRNLFSYDMNICQMLGRQSSPKFNLLNIWVKNFLKYGTMPRTCPILKGNYSWHGLKVDKKSVPSFASIGVYKANIHTYFPQAGKQKDSVANLTVSFEIN